ncbi:hypothetical protein C469_08775, partial [Halorubrum lipolyticum DSM 21995]
MSWPGIDRVNDADGEKTGRERVDERTRPRRNAVARTVKSIGRVFDRMDYSLAVENGPETIPGGTGLLLVHPSICLLYTSLSG